MTAARHVEAGDWIVDHAGAYRVDGVTVAGGLAYIGTRHGIKVVPADAELIVAPAT